MKILAGIALMALSILSNRPAYAVDFDWALVGNPGNAADDSGYGQVTYEFRISKQEITNAQYTDFLNAIAATDLNGLYHSSMGDSTRGGIVRSGVSGSYTYLVKPDAPGVGPGGSDYSYAMKPVVFVSFDDAMRFVNWLENSQPIGEQDSTTTEDGAYQLDSTPGTKRQFGAHFVIPNGNEWHKSAYHKNDGITGNYWEFPTASDTLPDNNVPTNDNGNSGNFFAGGFTTGSVSYPLTDAGAYNQSVSPYGTFDQAGNVAEWTEDWINDGALYTRGGYWGDVAGLARRGDFSTVNLPMFSTANTGFRIAYVPEPSTLLLALGCFSLLALGRRATYLALGMESKSK